MQYFSDDVRATGAIVNGVLPIVLILDWSLLLISIKPADQRQAGRLDVKGNTLWIMMYRKYSLMITHASNIFFASIVASTKKMDNYARENVFLKLLHNK